MMMMMAKFTAWCWFEFGDDGVGGFYKRISREFNCFSFLTRLYWPKEANCKRLQFTDFTLKIFIFNIMLAKKEKQRSITNQTIAWCEFLAKYYHNGWLFFVSHIDQILFFSLLANYSSYSYCYCLNDFVAVRYYVIFELYEI